MDATLTNLKYKRNLINFTFRIFFIIELLIKYRFILIFYLHNDYTVLQESNMDFAALQKILRAEEKIKKIESNLSEICLKTYDKTYNVDSQSRKHLLNSHVEYLGDHVEKALAILT